MVFPDADNIAGDAPLMVAVCAKLCTVRHKSNTKRITVLNRFFI
jgi:hypothetical protein